MISILSDNEFIAVTQSLEWTYAKSMPLTPHEYIVRGKTVDDDTYYTMYKTIESRGELREWEGIQYQYLHPGDGYYYWKMTDNMEESIIINRAKDNR